jgi:hypothetical protein
MGVTMNRVSAGRPARSSPARTVARPAAFDPSINST